MTVNPTAHMVRRTTYRPPGVTIRIPGTIDEEIREPEPKFRPPETGELPQDSKFARWRQRIGKRRKEA